MSALAPVLLLAIGNESRGDDALGPLLLRRLALWLEDQALTDKFELIEEFQLQIEHTLDIKGRELVLFIDAGKDTLAPYSFYEAVKKRLDGHTTHAVAPETLLGVYAMVHDEEPPPAFILCVAGRAFELGDPLSSAADFNLEQAAGFAQRLLATASQPVWQALAEDCRTLLQNQ